MTQLRARLWGALILGAALSLPGIASAQQAASPPPPTTAPTKAADKAPETPQPSVAPKPAAGSTAVPGWNNPPVWNSVDTRPQFATIPGVDRNTLVQTEGRKWREIRNGPVTLYGGWFLVVILALIMVFYLIKGPMRLHGQPTGRLIERFNAVERASHWVMAISFVALAFTGIVILFGKHIILPWLGYTGFSWLTIVSKNLHNFVGPLFIFSIIVFFLLFVRDNLWGSHDVQWFARMGGMFGGGEVPSGRFNAGEKAWFWGGLTLLGLAVSVTGLILNFPNWQQGREVMQLSNMIHGIAAVFFMVGAMGHTYMGTIGMQGAYRAMRDGYVDETWAMEHHRLWYDEIKQGKRQERILAGSAQPAMGD
jgi:formate dehydrogenase subunit gamma